MRLSVLSVLTLASTGMVSARLTTRSTAVKREDSPESKVSAAAAALSSTKPSDESATADCVGPLLCCGSLTTPLDPVVDPLLLALGIDAANIVGSIGLLCHGYDSTCESEPQCCTEANLLGGTLALGCADLKK